MGILGKDARWRSDLFGHLSQRFKMGSPSKKSLERDDLLLGQSEELPRFEGSDKARRCKFEQRKLSGAFSDGSEASSENR